MIPANGMEGVLAKLYDVLGRLGYPEITKIDLKDLAANVLSGQNRITLLTWLLSRSSATLSSHLEKLQGTSLKDEIVKCYLQMGISNDENTLLGNCSIKHELTTLRMVLLFAESLSNTDIESIDDSLIVEVLDKHTNETINIIPSSCHVSMKLTSREMEKYLEEIECNVTKPVCPSPACEVPEIEFTTNKDEAKSDDDRGSENGQTLSLDSVAGALSTAFESVDSWRSSQSSNVPTREWVNIDGTIRNMHKNLSFIAQISESKEAVFNMGAPKCLEKSETPLSFLIQDNVIVSEEIRKLYDLNNLDN